MRRSVLLEGRWTDVWNGERVPQPALALEA
jgi:hypothetical protein